MVTGKLIIQESLRETQCTLAVQKNDDVADTTNVGRDGSLPYVHAQNKWPTQSTNTSISQTKNLKRLFKYQVNVM